MQGLTRNPLASPGILGVNAGAASAVVVGTFIAGSGSLTIYAWYAFAGAAISAVSVYLLGSLGRGGLTPFKLNYRWCSTNGVHLFNYQRYSNSQSTYPRRNSVLASRFGSR